MAARARPGEVSMAGLVAAPDDEKSYEKLIVKVATEEGWIVNKTKRTPIKRGGVTIWITSTTVKGYPDLTCVHPAGYVLLLEVKGMAGRMKPEQRDLMRDVLQPAMDAIPDRRFGAYIVYPKDWPGVEAMLRLPARRRSGSTVPTSTPEHQEAPADGR